MTPASEHTQFLYVYATARASDGSITVLNRSTRELRQFSAAGAFIKSFGREGSGPGEFRNMTVSARSGDTLFIADSQLNRLTRFVAGRGFIGSSPLNPAGAQVTIVDRLRNGTMFVYESAGTTMRHPHGVFRDSMRLGVMTVAAIPTVRWIGDFSGWSHLAVNPKNQEIALAVGNYDFAGNLMLAAAGNEIFVGSTDATDISVYDATGKLTRKFTLSLAQRAFNEVGFSRAKQDAIANAKRPAQLAMVTERYNLKHRPKFEPYYERMSGSLDRSSVE